MEFTEALSIVRSVIPESESGSYDGIFVKKLEASNTLDEGRTTNQTHIAVTGEQMNMFPYLMADGYFNCSYEDRDDGLKKYFVTQIPFVLHKSNVDMLAGGEPVQIAFLGEDKVAAKASIMRSRRKDQTDQVQLSLTTADDASFIVFRKMLHAGDYLVLLKKRELFEYDCFGIRGSSSASESLAQLNNKFFKENTNTKVNVAELTTSAAGKTGGVGSNILFYGVPGSGKSFAINRICSDENYMQRVVFHPDYSYSDFVGQITPWLNPEKDNKLEYRFTPGPFTRIMQKAVHDPDNMYYLVIEEINRGNAPAIFGEIFQLLDRKDGDKFPGQAGESEYGISNYDIAREVYDGDLMHPVRIPSNLTILATMNTSDQNVFTLDTAFQRRWDMRHIPNDFNNRHAVDLIVDSEISWGTFATVVNEIVIENSYDMGNSGDKRLGAYFAKTAELSRKKFPEKVLKYLWDDAFKMDKQVVFDKRMTSLEKVLDAYAAALGDPLKDVLKGDVYQKMHDTMGKQGESAAENDGSESDTSASEGQDTQG